MTLIRNVRWNKLQDVIPPEIGELKQLTHLYLNNNYLTGGVPAQLANLTNLEILYLSYNRMTAVIPYNIAHSPKLTYSQVMRLVDPFRPWMQGDHVMIMILMTFFDFVAFVLDIQL
ncbi:hypothetical protein P3S68_011614 [Capsicum galapagoense]